VANSWLLGSVAAAGAPAFPARAVVAPAARARRPGPAPVGMPAAGPAGGRPGGAPAARPGPPRRRGPPAGVALTDPAAALVIAELRRERGQEYRGRSPTSRSTRRRGLMAATAADAPARVATGAPSTGTVVDACPQEPAAVDGRGRRRPLPGAASGGTPGAGQEMAVRRRGWGCSRAAFSRGRPRCQPTGSGRHSRTSRPALSTGSPT
jgi:hypothetical protein